MVRVGGLIAPSSWVGGLRNSMATRGNVLGADTHRVSREGKSTLRMSNQAGLAAVGTFSRVRSWEN